MMKTFTLIYLVAGFFSPAHAASISGRFVTPASVGEADLTFDVATQSELNTHEGNASAHHTATPAADFANGGEAGGANRVIGQCGATHC